MPVPAIIWIILNLIIPNFHSEVLDASTPNIKVYITVTAQRQIKLNWKTDEVHAGDVVALYDTDVSGILAAIQPLALVLPKQNQSNHSAITNITFPRQNLSTTEHMTHSTCLGFWICYIRSLEVIAKECLRTQPNWMNLSRSDIGNSMLRKIMIPGTHNSGSYEQDADDTGMLAHLVVTQDMPILSQLVYGIRYLDLRVGCYNDKFWINHDFLQTDNKLETVLNDVKTFLTNTDEIVILNFHRFPAGFKTFGSDNMRRYGLLIDLIESYLKDFMLPVNMGSNVVMNDIWATGKRLVVTFNTRLRFRIRPQFLWPGAQHLWADTDEIDELKSFLEKEIKFKWHGKMFSAMAHLTIKPLSAIFEPFKDTKYYADVVNDEVDHWFGDLWWQKTNVVASDFFLGNNLIAICIESNRRRSNFAQ